MSLPSSWRLGSLKLRYSSFKQLCRSHSSKPEPHVQNESNSLADAPKLSTFADSRELLKKNMKPFHTIPGPLSFPFIGTTYLYLFRIYSFNYLHKSGLKKYMKYGPLVREEIIPGYSIVWVFDPSDMERLFLSENALPQRRSHLAIGVFRKDRPDVYNTGGLLNVNGEDWWKLRKEFQKGFSAPKAVRAYLPASDGIIQEFVNSRLDQWCDDFLSELSRLFLQLTCLVAFDEKLNCFSSEEIQPQSRSSRLMEAAFTANRYILALDHCKDVKKSRFWPEFEKSMLFMEEVALELVKKKTESLAKGVKKDNSEEVIPSLLELYLTSPNLDYKDVVGMTVDLLLAGIDTTAYTASFALYHIANNQRVQNLLRLEARKLLPSPSDPITADVLANASYTRAVLKEVFRMNPISVGVGRIATEDLTLSGYHIPKGTNIVTQNQVSCRLEKYFVKPNEFFPERWLKGSPVQVKENPYLVLPFGHGPRSCIARRLAEQNLLTLLLRVGQSHEVVWGSKEKLDCETLLINKPDKPVKVSFSRLNKK